MNQSDDLHCAQCGAELDLAGATGMRAHSAICLDCRVLIPVNPITGMCVLCEQDEAEEMRCEEARRDV